MEKPDLYVVARFLDIIRKNGPAMRRTNVHMLLGIRYPRFNEYLDWLMKRGLVEERTDEEGVERIVLTSKGIESYHRLVDWIREILEEGVRI